MVKLKEAKVHLAGGTNRWHGKPAIVLMVVGPLLGLLYFLSLPFVGLTSCLLAGGLRAGRGIAARRRQITHTADGLVRHSR